MKRKTVCILGSENITDESKELLKEARKRSSATYVKIPEVRIESRNVTRVMAGNKNLLHFDMVMPRILYQDLDYGYSILKLLEGRVKTINTPESIVLAHYKFLTLLHLDAADIPIPDTYLASNRAAVEDILEKISYPVVMKLPYGEGGKGVMFADSRSSALSLVDTLERVNQPIFIEEYLEGGHEDIRAFVIGNEVVASMKRFAPVHDRRANVSTGGTAEVLELDKKLKSISISAAKVIGLEIAGIDIIETKQGPKIIEVNSCPGFAGIQKATGLNIASKIIDYLIEKKGI